MITVLLFSGCDSDSENLVSTGEQPGPYTTAPMEQAPPAATIQSRSSGKTIPDGELEIEISESGVIITANAVSQQTILYHLATQADFEITEFGVPWDVVTLDIQTDNLHAALVALLKQHPYQIIYEYDTDRQADNLAQVVVGYLDLPAWQEWLQGTVSVGTTADIPNSGTLPGVTETVLSADDQAYLEQMLNPSTEARENAAASIEPVGIALDYLVQIVTMDPSPDVRIAAAITLEDSKDSRAVEALIMALQDENPEVLVEVIGALEYSENRDIIPHLIPFLKHPDEDVRDAAESAIGEFN